jgi:type VI secretion system protein VasG
MKQIASMKLNAMARRLKAAHGVETEFEPGLLDELTRRCTEASTGARTVDHILRGSLMPRIARVVLEQLAAGAAPERLSAGLSPDGEWRIELA